MLDNTIGIDTHPYQNITAETLNHCDAFAAAALRILPRLSMPWKAVEYLLNKPNRLAHLIDAHSDACIDVTRCANRNVEFQVVVGRVSRDFSRIKCPPGCTTYVATGPVALRKIGAQRSRVNGPIL